MLNAETISQLTPSAAKILLTLDTLADRRYTPPRTRAPLEFLIQQTALSRATCLRALAQLQQLNLIQSHRPNRRRPATYLLLACGTGVSPLNPPMRSHSPIKDALEVSPMIPQPPHRSAITPSPAPKTPKEPPMRPQLTPPSGIIADTVNDIVMSALNSPFEDLLDAATIKHLMQSLSPEKNAELIQIAQATLRRPDAQESRP